MSLPNLRLEDAEFLKALSGGAPYHGCGLVAMRLSAWAPSRRAAAACPSAWQLGPNRDSGSTPRNCTGCPLTGFARLAPVVYSAIQESYTQLLAFPPTVHKELLINDLCRVIGRVAVSGSTRHLDIFMTSAARRSTGQATRAGVGLFGWCLRGW